MDKKTAYDGVTLWVVSCNEKKKATQRFEEMFS